MTQYSLVPLRKPSNTVPYVKMASGATRFPRVYRNVVEHVMTMQRSVHLSIDVMVFVQLIYRVWCQLHNKVSQTKVTNVLVHCVVGMDVIPPKLLWKSWRQQYMWTSVHHGGWAQHHGSVHSQQVRQLIVIGT